MTAGGATTTTVYVGGLEEVATGGSSTTTTAYYYAGGQRVAEAVNGALSFLASDALGSAAVAVAAIRTVQAQQLYAPYGGVRYGSGSMPTDYGFTGQHADATTGLDYYNARCYDPTAGQFASADTTPAGGLDRYAYVGDSPEDRTDSSGHLLTHGQGGGATGTALDATLYDWLMRDAQAGRDSQGYAAAMLVYDNGLYHQVEGYGEDVRHSRALNLAAGGQAIQLRNNNEYPIRAVWRNPEGGIQTRVYDSEWAHRLLGR